MSKAYLYPNGAGDLTIYPKFHSQYPATGNHYDKVDDAYGSEDDDTTYLIHLYTGAGDQLRDELFTMTSISGNIDTINYVRVYLRAKEVSSKPSIYYQCRNMIKVGGSLFYSSPTTITRSYANYYTEYTQNPATVSAWVESDFTSIQAGAFLQLPYAVSGYEGRCTQVYMEVDYNEPSGWQGTVMGVSNPSKIMGVAVENISKVVTVE